jgi:hypothetical protein
MASTDKIGIMGTASLPAPRKRGGPMRTNSAPPKLGSPYNNTQASQPDAQGFRISGSAIDGTVASDAVRISPPGANQVDRPSLSEDGVTGLDILDGRVRFFPGDFATVFPL